MGLRTDVIDLVAEIGKVTSIETAMDVFKSKMDDTQFSRIQQIKNENVLLKIANAIKMCEPDRVFINTGSAEDKQFIRQLALNKGEEAPLPMAGHTIHYDLKDEQGRRVVVKNGYHPERFLVTGIGPLKIKQSRVDDRRLNNYRDTERLKQ